MKKYLINLEHEIFIIEQLDNKPFNRGKLLNIGYSFALEKGCDYFVFHDVDMLPEDVDYSYTDKPLHLATHLQEHDYETTFFDYFGGVTMFNKEDFKTINGFSNEYWGWGFEDDDLLVRCLESNLELDIEKIKTTDSHELYSFKFNGDSFIKLEADNTTILKNDFTISVLVKPYEVKLNENKEYDEFPIISIPGYNIGLFYNSFRRFFCQTYDINKKSYSINSDIVGEAWVYLTMRCEDSKYISFFINGKLVDKIEMVNEILQLSTDEIFIGASNGKKENTEFFYGNISNIEIYEVALGDSEIVELSKIPNKPKIRNIGDYKSSNFLVTQLLPELSTEYYCIDLGETYKASLTNVHLYKVNQSFNTFLPKPYRRNSRFKSLEHKSNSSLGNKWIHTATRINQLKYYNEVRQHEVDFRIDGLNTLRFNKISEELLSDKTTIISVEL